MLTVPIGQYEIRDAEGGKKELFDVINKALVTDLELAKLIGTQALEQWWSRLCIDVSDVGKLPIESAFNAQSCLAAIALSTDALVVDVNDVTLTITADKVKEKLQEFRAEMKAAMDAWDRVLAGIKAATTVDEVLALHPGEPIMAATAAPESSGPRRFRGGRMV